MMRSTSFPAVVSPRGASVAPRMSTSSSSSSTRSSRGGLSTLNRPAIPQIGATTRAPMTSVAAIRSTLHAPQPRQMLSMMNPKMQKIAAPTPKMPHLSAGGSLERARRKLAQGGAVLPRSKKTVDMVENGRVVVRHQFYGKNAKEAQHMMNSHKKADRSFADAVAGKKYKGIDIKAVKRARGGRIPGYDDGGSIPSYDEYLASGAAPAGLDADQYPIDYQRYLGEVDQAQHPYIGNLAHIIGQTPDLTDPMSQREVEEGNVWPLVKPALTGGLSDQGKQYVQDAKKAYTKRFATVGSAAAGALAGGAPLLVPRAISSLLFANDLGKWSGVMPESVPSWDTFYHAIDETGVPDVHPFVYGATALGTGLASGLPKIPETIDKAKRAMRSTVNSVKALPARAYRFYDQKVAPWIISAQQREKQFGGK